MAYKQTLSYGGQPSTPKPKPGMIPEVSGMSDYEKRNYDPCNLILDAAASVEHFSANIGVPRDCQFNQSDPPQGGSEMELSNTIRSGPRGVGQVGGVYLPLRIRGAGLDTRTVGAGDATVSQNIGDPIDALTAQLPDLGVQVVSNLPGGTMSFPVTDNVTAAGWQGENPGTDATDSDLTFQRRSMSAKMSIATTAFSEKLLRQSSSNAKIKNIVTRQLMRAHALAIGAAMINGSGTENQPKGLLQQGINIVSVSADGGVPTYAKLAEVVRVQADANSDNPANAFLSSPKIRELLSTTPCFTSGSLPIYAGGRVLGYRFEVSGSVPQTLVKGSSGAVCHAILFGSWDQVLIGEWGVIELVVDPYRLKKQKMIEVTSYLQVDILCLQPAAFTAIVDAKLS